MEYERFFDELAPRLETARALGRELDRKLAHRFNVFDYLRDDELGLSRIIADLLDPEATHGQGTLFLQTLLSLDGLKNIRHFPDLNGSRKISVDTEQQTHDARRIDIFVEITGADGESYCLAFENKPSAGDLENQVKDYLKYLKQKYEERFLLIYLSGSGEGPSEWSLPVTERDKWKGRFAIMPYYGDQEERADQFKDFRIPHSLADWLGECRKNCEVDRLRWFLRDFETFCRRAFGGQAMIANSERDEIAKFVFSDRRHLKTALAVVESWPDVKERVCEEFLEGLRSRIEMAINENEKLKGFADGMRFFCKYEDKAWKSYVELYRECWTQYPEYPEQPHHRRTHIRLSNASKGPNGWGFSVGSPMPKGHMKGEYGEYADRREQLVTKLKPELGCGKDTDWCPWWWNGVAEDKKNWSSLIPDLYLENKNQNQGGEITKYFVEKFTEIAEKAMPIIDKIEGGKV